MRCPVHCPAQHASRAIALTVGCAVAGAVIYGACRFVLVTAPVVVPLIIGTGIPGTAALLAYVARARQGWVGTVPSRARTRAVQTVRADVVTVSRAPAVPAASVPLSVAAPVRQPVLTGRIVRALPAARERS